ncbi:MAG: DUF4012 domain-containing protein [Patescibacteria group bacterium]
MFNKTEHQKISWLKIGIYLIIFLFFLGLIWGIKYAVAGYNVYQLTLEAKQNLELAQNNFRAGDLTQTAANLNAAKNNFSLAKQFTNQLLEIKWLPKIGQQIEAADYLLSIGGNLSTSLEEITNFAADVWRPLQDQGASINDLTPEQKEYFLKRFFEAPPLLQGAQAEIDLATLSLEKIPPTGLIGPLQEATELIKVYLPLLNKITDQGIPLSQIFPYLAGYAQEKTYLFILQNNTELRPTGGFIGTYGILKIKNGEIKEFWTDDIYALDGPTEGYLRVEPPMPIKKYLNKNWYLRDANWSPDFPITAEKIIWFYQQEGGQESIDGVIAIDPQFISDILSNIGDLNVQGLTFTPDNLLDQLQYEVEIGYAQKTTPVFARKGIVSELANQLISKVKELPARQWPLILETIDSNLQEKHILLYDTNKFIENFYLVNGWGGEIAKVTTEDYLMIIDSNMASLKTDRVVDRAIDYQVEKINDQLKTKLTITYTHHGTRDYRTSQLKTYTRIYTPLGSQLLSSDLQDLDHYDELDKTVFGGLITVEPGKTKTVNLEYLLPTKLVDLANQGIYSLLVQKQAGTIGHKLNIRVKLDNSEKAYQTDLLIDRQIEIYP